MGSRPFIAREGRGAVMPVGNFVNNFVEVTDSEYSGMLAGFEIHT